MSEKANPTEKGTITLKIDDVSTYLKKIGQRTRSPRQKVAGIEWHIYAYPSIADEITYLWCYLKAINANKWSAWVDATCRTVKKNGGLGEERSFHAKLMGKEPLVDECGWFLSSKVGAAQCDQRLRGQRLGGNPRGLQCNRRCGTSFNAFETAGALAADIKLQVGDSVFYANKGYLSVVSSVFRDMFALTEAAESKTEMEEIELKDLGASEFKEFLGVVYPTCYPVTDVNVISLFRIADCYDVKRLIADCECHLRGANSVPSFDKLKLAVDLNRDELEDHLISKMTCNDLKALKANEDLDQLGVDVLQALFEKHVDIHHG